MNNKKLHFLVLATLYAAVMAMILPVVSNAQNKNSNKYSKRDVSNIIAKLEQSSNEFRRDFDRNLDQSSINGTREEDRLNKIVQNYEQALNRLRREYDRSDNWWQSRNNVQNVMDEAQQVNTMMNNLSFARKLERQWNNMRRDLNKLADTFELPGLNGGGGGGGNVPNWAIGTFYARNPQTGGRITMSINNNGSVAITFDNGATSYATINGDMLNNGGIYARVTKINNGIRTTRTDNGEKIDYYSSYNGGGYDNNNGGGNVPNWAVGTFYGRNPQTGGRITMSISSNGSVAITYENGSASYATLNGDRLYNNGIEAKVTKINNGIRTTRTDNGERIDYRRQ